MQETNHSFTELKTKLLGKLADRGCTTITITGYTDYAPINRRIMRHCI